MELVDIKRPQVDLGLRRPGPSNPECSTIGLADPLGERPYGKLA